MEQPSRDPEKMELAFQAAAEIGVPIVNCGPGGASDDESKWPEVVDSLGNLSARAEHYGVTLCVKAHVGASIYNTPTTLRIMEEISSPAFGIDMDPSHIHRAGENPVEAIAAVVSRVKHVHIRDCKGMERGPGAPELQANGRGDIDLVGYIRVLHENGYTGPLNLEVIGAGEYSLEQCLHDCCRIAWTHAGVSASVWCALIAKSSSRQVQNLPTIEKRGRFFLPMLKRWVSEPQIFMK